MKKKGQPNGQKNERAGLYQDDWWLEHLEDEFEPSLREDLEVLLKNSKKDQQILESLQKTRAQLKASEDVVLPESGHYYDNLHDKIMAALDEEVGGRELDLDSTPETIPNRVLRPTPRSWSPMFSVLGLTMGLVLVSILVWKNQAPMELSTGVTEVAADSQDGDGPLEQRLAMLDIRKPSSIDGTMLGFESESDFVSDAAARRLEGMNDDEIKQAVSSLKN